MPGEVRAASRRGEAGEALPPHVPTMDISYGWLGSPGSELGGKGGLLVRVSGVLRWLGPSGRRVLSQS